MQTKINSRILLILYSPFLHFLVLGTGLFGLYGFLGNNLATNENDIVIDDSDIQKIVATWKAQYNRDPNKNELVSLFDNYIKQEIYYREALKLNLEHNDEIIRRRLAQKMEFVSTNLASNYQPTDDELKKFYNENTSKYQSTKYFSFYQICISLDKNTDPFSIAKEKLDFISHDNKSISELEHIGDVTVFPFFYSKIDKDSLTQQLGSKFADSLDMLEKNVWTGPVESAYCEHLVFLNSKTVPKTLVFNEVKDIVLSDFIADSVEKFNETTYLGFRKNYSVKIDSKDIELKKVIENDIKTK